MTDNTYSLNYNGKLNINENDLMIKEGEGNVKSINERLNDINNSVDVKLDNLKTTIFQTIYPVGSIYTSFNNINPNSIFGFGTWERINNQFLFCAGDDWSSSSDSTFNATSKTGGEIKHKLIVDELPSHSHEVTKSDYCWGTASAENHRCVSYYANGDEGPTTTTFNCSSIGSNQSHNNMPPYITCYAWRRTA